MVNGLGVDSFSPYFPHSVRVVFHGHSSSPIRSFAVSTTISEQSREKSKSPYELGPHRSDAEDLAAALPVIEVDSDVAICAGGKQKMR